MDRTYSTLNCSRIRGDWMSKRFTDSEKWKDPWFGGLTVNQKVIWYYLCDACDSVGIWKVNLPLLGFYLGEPVSIDTLKELGRRLVWLSDEKVWLPGFLKFQYSNLSATNKAHRGIMKKILQETNGLPLDDTQRELIEGFKTLIRGSGEGQVTPQEKEKEEIKEKDKFKEEEEALKVLKPKRALFATATELILSIGLVDQQKIAHDYPDPVWVNRQITLCFDHFTAEPAECPRTAGKWMQKVRAWLESGWAKREQAPKPRYKPETGGWADIDGVS